MIQSTGDKAPLPTAASGHGFRSAEQGEVQTTGDAVELGRNPVGPPTPFRGGEVEVTGDSVKVGTAPVKGWGSASDLGMSRK